MTSTRSGRRPRPAPAGGSTGTVAGLLRRVQALALVGVLLLGTLGLAGAVLSLRATSTLTDELMPVQSANDSVLQALTDAETGVRAYSLTGLRTTLGPYFAGIAELPGHERVLRQYAAGDPELAGLVAAQEDAAQAWLDGYAAPKLAGPGGPAAFDAELFATGRARFDALRARHAEVSEALTDRVVAIEEDTRRRLVALVIGTGLVLAALLAGALVGTRRLDREVVVPLARLEDTVHALTQARQGARAPEGGRREVRSVAVALNELAEAQERARAVEEQVRDELRRLDAARTDFVSNVSHELRTPLTTIAGYVEMVADEFEGELSPRHERMLDAGRRNVERLRCLIDDILTLSRAESPSTDLQTVSLRDVVADCVVDLRMTASGRGVDLALAQDRRDPLLVLADPGQLSRAVLNLLSNAVKFSPEGGSVEVTSRREGESLVLTVADHGIGIPAAELAQLGTRFFRASNAVDQSIPGTGLGLRIVQTILEHHGGRLHLASVVGEGTTATVRLPAQAREQGAEPQGPQPQSEPEPQTGPEPQPGTP